MPLYTKLGSSVQSKAVGTVEGDDDGFGAIFVVEEAGCFVGTSVGDFVGDEDGCLVGNFVGTCVGDTVG